MHTVPPRGYYGQTVPSQVNGQMNCAGELDKCGTVSFTSGFANIRNEGCTASKAFVMTSENLLKKKCSTPFLAVWQLRHRFNVYSILRLR